MAVERAWEYQTRGVTDLTEEEILREAGEEGWELTDLGPLALHLRRPQDAARHVQWEYTRHSGTLSDRARHELLAAGWKPAAHSAVFHYLKRPRGIRPPRGDR